MKKLFLMLFFAASAHAAVPPVFQLPPPIPLPAPSPAAAAAATGLQTFEVGLPLPEFLHITLGEMLHRAYVLMPEAGTSLAPISIDLSRSKLKDPLPLVRAVLDSLGLAMREVSGVLFIEKAKSAPEGAKINEDTLIYKPKHRSIGSLSSYFSLFPDLTFSYAAGISTRSAAPASLATTTPAAGGQAPAQVFDSGATTYSQVDKDPSFLVVRGNSSLLSKFSALIAQLDVAIPEVFLRVYVLEVRSSENRDSAVSFVANLLNGQLGITAGQPGAGGDSLRISLPNVSLAVTALTGNSRVKLISSPVLRALDGTTANAVLGADTPTLGAIITNQNGTVQQSVVAQPSGVLLSVTPRVFEDSIRLSISQELSSFVKTETGVASTPTKLRRSFKSDVVAKNGEALLLGGLSEMQETDAKQENFSFFGSKSAQKSTSEIVVLIQVERI